jgi:hypothetical protein
MINPSASNLDGSFSLVWFFKGWLCVTNRTAFQTIEGTHITFLTQLGIGSRPLDLGNGIDRLIYGRTSVGKVLTAVSISSNQLDHCTNS